MSDSSSQNALLQSLFFGKKTSKDDQLTHEYSPLTLAEYIGQKNLKNRLSLYIKAALQRKEPLDHLLLFGPPGLGKTTLASIIAHEMNANLRVTSGPQLHRSGDLIAILSSLKAKDILFIDEIHRLPITVEETLYSAMEQFKIDIIMGEGVGAKTIVLPIQSFTLIGASTKIGSLSSPLRSRFGITEKFDFYEEEDLALIIKQSSSFFNINLEDEALLLIASCSRGTPRIAKKLMRKIRDFIMIYFSDKNIITRENVQVALSFFRIKKLGLTDVDLKILSILNKRGSSKPIGLESLAILVGEDSETVEDVYEPFLLQQDFIERTSRGRIIGKKIYIE